MTNYYIHNNRNYKTIKSVVVDNSDDESINKSYNIRKINLSHSVNVKSNFFMVINRFSRKRVSRRNKY